MTLVTVGGYRLDVLLGTGGMGEVYKAYDTRRDRFVALKLLPVSLSGDKEYLSRFKRESNVVARLRDPHIIPIHDFGEIDGRLFIDMRLVDGSDIGSLIQSDGPVGTRRAAHFVGQVAEALDAAHADHLVHRDIKPSNILVTANDFVYVIDFGITRVMDSRQTSLTGTGAMIGTLHYMAPERFTSQEVDGRADVYSLACVLHECLTGEPPFGTREIPALIYAHLNSSPPSASDLAEGIPPALDDVIARGMAKDPADRFATAGQLAAAVRQALQAETAPGSPAGSGRGTQGSRADTSIPDRLAGFATTWPRQEAPPDISPEPHPAQDPDPGSEQAAAASRLRRNARALAALAGAAAAVTAVIVFAVVMPGAGKKSPTASITGPDAPKAALPVVAGTVRTGQYPSYIEVAPNGRFAYVTDTGANAITVLDTVTNKVSRIIPIPEGPPQFVSFSDDGRTAFVSVYTTSGSVHLVAFVDTATGNVTGAVPVTNHTPGPSQVSPDGRYLYVPNHNSMTTSSAMKAMSGPGQDDIDVINVAAKKLASPIPVDPNPHWIVFGQGSLFYVTSHTSGMITVVNSRNNRVVRKFAVGETPHAIDISPDKSRLAVTSYGAGQVYIVSTATDKVIAAIPVGREPLDLKYSPDGRYLYNTNYDDSTISVISTATNKVIGTVSTGEQPTSIDVLPSGRQAYVTDEGSGSVEILNLPR